MPAGQGNKLAINNGATWGTIASANFAGAAIFYNSLEVNKARETSAVEAIGTTIASQRNDSNITCDATLTCPLQYEHMPRLFNLFAADTLGTPGSTVTHTFTAPLVPRYTFLSLAEEIAQVGGSTIYRDIASASGVRFTMSGRVNEVVMISIDLLCDNELVGGDATTSTLSTATLPPNNAFVKMAAADTDFFKVADYGSPPANYSITEFTWTYEINKEGGDFTTGSATIGIPDEVANHRSTLEIVIDKWAADTNQVDLQGNTARNAVFTFPSATVSNQTNDWTIKFPNLTPVTAPASTSGPGKISDRIMWDVLGDVTLGADTAADTTGGAAWEMVVTNTDLTDYDTALS